MTNKEIIDAFHKQTKYVKFPEFLDYMRQKEEESENE